jgi:hypothetical protein
MGPDVTMGDETESIVAAHASATAGTCAGGTRAA